ncbi:hypothetical protein M378DRAFT_16603 [Amanita muscaria Koide BX008]|uniref:Uncharacterized protein n=1 Tax=Amanita muscaria (strain Koide BX008) TaxID=946122 RepID=A0A0C2WLB6_AMAMK|nr:hypothetical protein M378DRAFT_16603 [Amanita muscaria Koide BX008]
MFGRSVSLSEAIVDEIPTSRSPANTIYLQSPSRERDDVPSTTVIDTPPIVADFASVDGIDKPSASTARTTDDDSSATLVPPRPLNKHKQDKSMMSDWMELENRVDLRLYLQLTRTRPQSPAQSGEEAKNDKERVWNAWNPDANDFCHRSYINCTRSREKFYRADNRGNTCFYGHHVRKSHVKQVQQLLPPPPRQITTRLVVITSLRTTFSVPLAQAEPHLTTTSAEAALMTVVGERTLTQSPEDVVRPTAPLRSSNIVSSAQDASRHPWFMNKPGLQTYHLPRTYKALPYGPSFTSQDPQVAELAHMPMKQARNEGLGENDEEGDEEGSFTGEGGDTRSFKSRRSTGIDIVQDKCTCDGSLVDFVPGPGRYAESVRSTSSGKSKRQGTNASSTSNSNGNGNRQAIAGGSSRTSLPTALSISATVLPP